MKRAWILVLLLCACRERPAGYALIGEPERGRVMVAKYGCTSCHIVPGVEGGSYVGPPLERIGARMYLAGQLPNVPQTMIEWIRFPHRLKPKTGMPEVGVTQRDARDIAAYLYTLH